MRKFWKNLNLITSCFLLASMTSLTLLTTSCNKGDGNIKEIALYPESDTIRPAESIIIRAVVMPSGKRTNNLNWEIVDNPIPELTISSIGVLRASDSVKVSKPIKVTVKATAKNNSSVFATTDIYVLQQPTYDFQGFVNNEIRYLDRLHNVHSMKLKKIDEFTYVPERHIDVFEMDDLPKPEGFTSFFDFTPIIVSQSLRYMRFDLMGSSYGRHAIMWDFEYEDGSWTETIPNFDTYNSSALFEKIDVTFACDPRIHLYIDLDAWQNPRTEESQTIFSYHSQDKQDIHDIEYDSENIYVSYLYCPAFLTSGIQTGVMPAIYCYRPKAEYAEFEFEIEPSPALDPSIADMMTINPGLGETFEPDLYTRTVDHLRYYEFSLSYEFDLSKREHTAEYYDYKTLPLFSINVYDPVFYNTEHNALVCRCDFYLDWIF